MKTALKAVGFVFFVLSVLWLAFVWADLGYRRYLYSSYGSHPYWNHVDETYFASVPARAHFGAACAAVALVFAAILRRWRFVAACLVLAVSGLAAPRLLDSYHRSLILVTYKEFTDAEFGSHAQP